MLKSEIKIIRTPYNLALNDNKRINDLKTFKTKPYHFDNILFQGKIRESNSEHRRHKTSFYH
jgi:hypothetical protein